MLRTLKGPCRNVAHTPAFKELPYHQPFALSTYSNGTWPLFEHHLQVRSGFQTIQTERRGAIPTHSGLAYIQVRPSHGEGRELWETFGEGILGATFRVAAPREVGNSIGPCSSKAHPQIPIPVPIPTLYLYLYLYLDLYRYLYVKLHLYLGLNLITYI